jgi:hypothetical protein
VDASSHYFAHFHFRGLCESEVETLEIDFNFLCWLLGVIGVVEKQISVN